MDTQPILTILIVNYDSADFIGASLYALSNLTANTFVVHIVDNDSSTIDYNKLRKITANYSNVNLERNETKLRGSLAHGTTLNQMVEKVETPFFSILDADATWLKKDWDKILISRINEKTKIIGCQNPKDKDQDFPNICALLIETETFKKLNIDFRPDTNNLHNDTGYQLREKYLQAGYRGKFFEVRSTRQYKGGPFGSLILDEWYLDKDYQNTLGAHFGRGSSLGANKYIKTSRKYLYKLPILGRILLIRKGLQEKKGWLRTCREIIDNQYYLSDPRYETLSQCPYCQSGSLSLVFNARDQLTNKPGIYYLARCNDCQLVFQNPRIRKEYIREYYSDELGYYHPSVDTATVPSRFKRLSEYLHNQTLVNHFDYPGKRNLVLKLLTLPVVRKVKQELTPYYIDNGRLLEIGCSHGQELARLKELGWTVGGVEMDSASARYAVEHRNLNVTNKEFDEVSFPPNSFDVIIMSMVLEHLYDPFTILKTVTGWLKPNGSLLFSIPYFEGCEFKLFKDSAYGLQLPTHITFLNKMIIRKYLTNIGYSKIGLTFQNFDRDIVAGAQYKYADTGRMIYRLVYNTVIRKLITKPAVSLLSILGKTSRVCVYATKNEITVKPQ